MNQHPGLIEELRADIPHTIRVLDSQYQLQDYTCAVHSFDLVGNETYVEIATYGLGRTFAGREFVDFVVDAGFVEHAWLSYTHAAIIERDSIAAVASLRRDPLEILLIWREPVDAVAVSQADTTIMVLGDE